MARSVCNVATASDAGKRLDVFCFEAGAYGSRSAAAKACAEGRVLVGGRPASKKQLVNAGDAIVCELDDEGALAPLAGEPIELDVRYEDDDLAVISKQAGLICHPANEHRDGTLVNALIYRYGADGLCDVQGESDRLGIVHRLDADTSGLMLVARTDAAGQALMEAISLRQVDRRYITLVHGIIVPDTGLIDAPIMRNPADRTSMCVGDGPSSRDAITTFQVLERFEGNGMHDGYTLVECKLYTGRTHQIRVHMQYIKHPVVGDPLYRAHGPKDAKSQLGLSRQFLHSYQLGFDHPTTGERMEFADELPEDLACALETLSSQSAMQSDESRLFRQA